MSHEASSTHTTTLSGRIERETGVRAADCYQCGKCTAGCPAAAHMDLMPSEILRLVQANRPEYDREALGSTSVWMCVGCETCVTRCPKEVDLPKVMDFLRAEAMAKDLVNEKTADIVTFHQAFLDSIAQHGRIFELGMMASYKLRSGALFEDVGLAPAMFLKGKLSLLPHGVHNTGAIAKIFERAAALSKPHDGHVPGDGHAQDDGHKKASEA